ncbi:MAG TPA: PDZ domain-containing protein [Synergistaceae bacterium]|nr:PDZ domain-containing protein [Synergistaceae bacterium]HQF91996.1 PDZ domain-containing protein [Synergistaceae bacterium]HQH78807.1 PDZ domain-containing protein [Synergistaceae bacterium]HQK24787.1 PDZ domain-containing protein [Synergistaceae bacterium]
MVDLPWRVFGRTFALGALMVALFAPGARGELLSGVEMGPPDGGGRIPVVRVRSDSPGALAGLRPGDWVVELDGVNIRGRDPAEVSHALERTLGGGFSAVVIFVRDQGSQVARLRPPRPLHHQRVFLDFRRDYLRIAAESDALWEGARRGMEGALFQGFPERSLEELLRETLWKIRALGTRMENMAIPSFVPDLRAGTLMGEARNSGYRALRKREEALRILADYEERRRTGAPFEHNLWLRLQGYDREVRGLMARGERDLLEGLSLVARHDAAFGDLLAQEREEEAMRYRIAPR